MQHLSDTPRLVVWTDHHNSSTLKQLSCQGQQEQTCTQIIKNWEPSMLDYELPLRFSAQKEKLSRKLAINKQFTWQEPRRYCKDIVLHASNSCTAFQSGSQWSVATADCTKLQAVEKTMCLLKIYSAFNYATKDKIGVIILLMPGLWSKFLLHLFLHKLLCPNK